MTVREWPVVSAGGVVQPITALANLLAETPAMRTRCGLLANDPDASGKLLGSVEGIPPRIFYPEVDWASFDVFPSAVIRAVSLTATQTAAGVRNYFQTRGSVELILIDDDSSGGTVAESFADYGGWVGQVLAELLSQFGVDDTFAPHAMRQDASPGLYPDGFLASAGKLAWGCSYLFDWGVR